MSKIKNIKDTYDGIKDKYNAAQDTWNDISDFSQKLSDGLGGSHHDESDDPASNLSQLEDESTNAQRSGSLDDATPEERRAAIADSEESAQGDSSFYNGSGGGSPYKGKDLKSRMLRLYGVKQAGASTGIFASIMFIGGILISMSSGGSLFSAIEKNLTNDANDDARTSAVLHRAFNNMFSVCKPGTLSCKFKTMTKEQTQKWKDAGAKVKGVIVDKLGNPIRGSPTEVVDPDKMQAGERVKMEGGSIEFHDGTVASTASGLNTASEKPGISSRLLSSINPISGSFLHGNFGKLISKFGINKTSASPEEKKTNQARENPKAAAEEGKSKVTQPASVASKILLSNGFDIATTGIDMACSLYTATRIAVATQKAKWTSDLIRFAYPFLRVASKVADGSATEQDFDEIEARAKQLTDYLPAKRAEELKVHIKNNSLTDEDKSTLEKFGVNVIDPNTASGDAAEDVRKVYEKQNQQALDELDYIKEKNALDSQGLQAAIYGDSSSLQEFTKRYTTGVISGGEVFASYILSKVQNAVSFGGGSKEGKRNIKSFCILNRALSTAAMAGGFATLFPELASCAAPPFLVNPACAIKIASVVGKAAATSAVIYYLTQGLAAGIIASIIAKTPVLPDLDLRGPAAGSAIAAGLSLLLAHKAASSGLKPAMSTAVVSSFIASTQDAYDKYTTDIAYYNARKTPFDVSNRYSFASQVLASLNPNRYSSGQESGYIPFFANIYGTAGSLLTNTANAFHSQPSLMTITDQQLKARLSNGECEVDEEKRDAGMMCDRTSGRTVQVMSPRVLQWAKEDATGKTDHLADTIKWLQQSHDEAEAKDGGGTHDETCGSTGMQYVMTLLKNPVNSFVHPTTVNDFADYCSRSGELASIKDDGTTIPESQFDMYIKNCINRDIEPGSTDIDLTEGSPKQQAWRDGTQCALTYDTDGNPSTDLDKFNKDKDTGIGSLMMDHFAYYYHMCYVQYAVANGTTDCTVEDQASTAVSTP